MQVNSNLKNRMDAVWIPAGGVTLRGDLCVPPHASGIVVFAHGSGSSRLSPRNQYVARELEEANVATLLLDLMTEDEERDDMDTGHLRFDIAMLGDRLVDVIDWLTVDERTSGLNIGLFGASTGAAAAIHAANRRSKWVRAIVSRGGRPDLAGLEVSELTTPILLVVGMDDRDVLKLNKKVMNVLTCPKQMTLIENATHLFEEPGALTQVTEAAKSWFLHHLT
ncbi:hypothetical protein KF728_06100 [Candidatus Obscuribacterales bacterium]|nr:hypothetical protein [Candidatus Obscuribacterales bacterium]